ncbi:cytochrome c [Alkalilimnicola ehrlichii]|nr:cytochrome c [Alkalilimnicola ehrlichii]
MKRIFVMAAAVGLLAASFQATASRVGDPVAGREKAAACIACHGEDGNSPNPQFPRLAGQYADYMVQALRDYKSGNRRDPVMNGIAADLSEQDMRDISAYYASQEGDLHVKRLR